MTPTDHKGTWTPPPDSPQARAIAHVTTLSAGEPADHSLRVTLHFHPDRLHEERPILRALADDLVYRSQFETRTSNGWLSPERGGSRWRWESRIFAGAYDDAEASERPKYGALNYRRRPIGGSPRFGSAHLRLRPEVLARCTFCYPDSSAKPEHFGTAGRMSLVALASSDARDPIDDHIEAQVHGPVRLATDVEALVLDPCYRGTEVEAVASELPCAIEWHPGFVLTVDALRQYPDFREQGIAELGLSLAIDGRLTPAMLGDAARTGRYDPQHLKKVWHYIARFGYAAW